MDVSLHKMMDDMDEYKHLLYTDNSHIVPKHIGKLLEVIKFLNLSTIS